VELDDGEVLEIDTVAVEGIDGRYFVAVVDGDVDAEGFARHLWTPTSGWRT
jgi:hypothetical protein